MIWQVLQMTIIDALDTEGKKQLCALLPILDRDSIPSKYSASIQYLHAYKGSLCMGEQCVIIYKINLIQMPNSEHILITSKLVKTLGQLMLFRATTIVY